MNPCQPGHKIYSDYIDVYPNTYVGGYNYEHFTLADNYSITPERRREIESQYVVGSIWYKRDIKGERCLAEGLIFPMYLDAIGTPPDEPCDEECISLDYGTQNPLAALYWKRYGKTWWAVDEYYYSGRKKLVQKTDADYVTDMKRFYAKNHEVKEDMHGEDIDPVVTCIVDPSASSFIAALRREDMFKVRKGKNDVEDGLRETATALQEGYIHISETCTNWKTEAGGYIWDSTKPDDEPLKVDDHLMDSMRYLVKTLRLALPKEEYKGVYS
jgi:PBSX family phage terminase large subunit